MSANEPVFSHLPVMLDQVLEAFADVAPGVVVDATCGGAGHATAILTARPDQHLVGLDRDPLAVDVSRRRMERFGTRAEVRHLRFDHLREVTVESTATTADRPIVGVLFDLGVSSTQFDVAERGFSYRNDAPLDMRMDTSAGPSAADIVNTATVGELRHLIAANSDERFADRIARAIVAARPVLSTIALAEIITGAIPAATRRKGGHPAKRTFQALRIEVNDELRILAPAIDAAIDVLSPGGRCVVMSYHSGEDRIVKSRFRFAETGGCTCPSDLPCVCGALPRGRMTRRGVTRPTDAEIASNPRAASAVLRIFQKSDATVSAQMAGTVGVRAVASEWRKTGAEPKSETGGAPSLRSAIAKPIIGPIIKLPLRSVPNFNFASAASKGTS